MSTLDRSVIRAFAKHRRAPSGRPRAPDGGEPTVAPPSSQAQPPATVYTLRDDETVQRLVQSQTDRLVRLLGPSGRGQALRPAIWQVRSVHRGEGRTTLTWALAQVWSRAGARVLVVDGDPECAALSHRLVPPPHAGWAVLAEMARPDQIHVLACPFTPRLSVLAWHGAADKSARATVASRLLPALPRLLESFDRILIDMGSGAPANDERAPVGHSEIYTLVVRDVRRTTPEALQAFVDQLAGAGLSVVGCIDNFVQPETFDAT